MLRARIAARVVAVRHAAPRMRRRRFATPPEPKRPAPPGERRRKMTREEVEELAESAKAQQRLFDAENSLFGGNASARRRENVLRDAISWRAA